jgi:lipid-binding SYLF domain-containing protein
MNMPRFGVAVVAGVCAVGAGWGCATSPKSEADRDTLTNDVNASLSSFKNADPTLQDLLSRSQGYAVFPDVGKAGFIAGGAYGRGQLFEGNRAVGYCDITEGTVGLQAGAQTYGELIVFVTRGPLEDFKADRFAFSANASAVAIKSGASAAADYSKGVVVFIQPKGGLMAEASVGGQRFRYRPM